MSINEIRQAPIVSVIIPTFNRANLVGRAIRSVLNQTFQDFEIIVVDDGSKDNTEQVVKGFKDSRMVYVKHRQNRGVSVARNTGLKLATGKYMAFLDSDDEYVPEKLETNICELKHSSCDVGFVYSNVWWVQRPGRKRPLFEKGEGTKVLAYGKRFEHLCKKHVPPDSIVLKKDCAATERFDEELPAFEDREFWFNISMKYQGTYIDESLVLCHRQNRGEGICTNPIHQLTAVDILLNRYSGQLRGFSSAYSALLGFKGHLLCVLGKPVEGREYFLSAIKTHPPNVRYIILYLISIFGSPLYLRIRKIKRSTLSLPFVLR